MKNKNVRDQRFTFQCSVTERELITAIAERLHRSQGDALRFLVHAAAQELKLNLSDTSSNTLDLPAESNISLERKSKDDE